MAESFLGLIVIVLLGLALSRPMSFADGPLAADVSSVDGGAEAGSPAAPQEEGSGSGDQGSGGQAADPGAGPAESPLPEPDDDGAAMIQQAISAQEAEQAAQAESEVPAAPGAPPAGPAAAADGLIGGYTPEQVFEQLGIDPSQIPQDPAALPGWIAEKMYGYYAEQFVPQATAYRDHLAGIEAQQQQWSQKLDGFMQSPAYGLAAQLADDPQLYAAVRDFVSGNGNGNGQAAAFQMPNLNAEDLDPETRGIYEMGRHAVEQNEALRTELQQMQQHMGALHETQNGLATREQQRAHTDAQRQQQAAYAATDGAFRNAVKTLSDEYGFDVRTRGAEFATALKYANQQLGGMLRDHASRMQEWDRNGRRGPPPQEQPLDVAEILRIGMRAAGLEGVKTRRAAQAASGTRPPGDRAARIGRLADCETAEDFVSHAIASAG